jgi:hypothetical protein
VTGLLDRLVYLSSGLALILAFIGVKLILHWAHGLDSPGTGDHDGAVAGRHSGGAGRHDGGQPDQVPA